MKKSKFLIALMLCIASFLNAQIDSVVFYRDSTWTVPNGVTSVTAQCWGAGGGGGGGNSYNAMAGGGGGGYSAGTVSVVSLNTYSVTVGIGGTGGTHQNANLWQISGGSGGTSSFQGISASGGTGPYYTNYTINSAGGIGTGGSVNYSGGTGSGVSNSPTGGGGGGCAGPNGNGGNGSIPTGGIGTLYNGGNGGNGKGTSINGDNGFIYGGGGGGGGLTGNGGTGANGLVIIKWKTVMTGVEKITSPIQFINPNPFTSSVVIQLTSGQLVRIFNIAGQLVYSSLMPSGSDRINLDNVPAGMYFLNVGGDTRKLVKY